MACIPVFSRTYHKRRQSDIPVELGESWDSSKGLPLPADWDYKDRSSAGNAISIMSTTGLD
jgi:hypothetical protein